MITNKPKDSGLVDLSGNAIPSTTTTQVFRKQPKKQAMGLFGNIFSYGNAGRYKYRYYTLSDTNNGLDAYSRELLVRWSREMAAQMPIISTAIRIHSQFSVGDAYVPHYIGNNSSWGKIATDWLKEEWMQNCSTKGPSYDFNTLLNLICQNIDIDGDILQVFGTDAYGYPKFQLIPSHRIRGVSTEYKPITEGKYKGYIACDGIIYTPQGKPAAYCVENARNLVNSLATETETITFDSNDARLLFQARFLDKHRGIPTIAPGILQAISLQELNQYEMDKSKIQSMVGLVEHTPNGEAPLEFQNTLSALQNQVDLSGNANMLTPNDHAVKVVNGPEIRYVMAEGGKIEPFQSTGPDSTSQQFMTKLETEVLSTLGVPHQLLYSTDKIGGRITSAIGEIFRASIRERQAVIDKQANFTVSWAVGKAIEAGILPENNEENLLECFNFTKPQLFSLDSKYDNDIILNNLESGVVSLNDVTTRLYNKTSTELLDEQKQEQVNFYKAAQEVSKETGIDINTVISNWKKTPVKTTVTTNTDQNTQDETTR